MATLDEQYIQIANQQRNYLAQIQDAFKKHCEEISAEAAQKITTIPETNLPARQNAFEEQKKKLEEALAELRKETDRSMAAARKKLEEINTQREQITLQEIENFMTK